MTLLDLIDGLRLDRTRSAWSRSQTLPQSLAKLKGEIDECRDALDEGDPRALEEELGDILWSLLFALIVAGDEHGLSLERISATALSKLKYRKPWLYEAGRDLSLEEEAALWSKAKEREKTRTRTNGTADRTRPSSQPFSPREEDGLG
ncbi:MazG nucleotide pyrophosphohydrolase domain-containing protein [Telmatospirillum siberiense]|nr:MazG nucleotide pyrophosphohydrolase domain-containing protein [Telmatospirillum siberiense]